MPRGVQSAWPTEEQLLDLAREEGGIVSQMAVRLEVSESSLRGHLKRHKLLDKVRAVKADAPTLAAKAAEEVPVDDPQRIRIVQLEAKVRQQNSDLATYSKALANQEAFFDRVVEAARVPVEVPRYKLARRTGRKPNRSAVVPIYDQQYGQLVRPLDTPGGQGGYNATIYDQRQARWLEGVTGNLRDYADSHHLDELILVMGGDHIEGEGIFRGQEWQLEMDPCRQVVELAEKMSTALAELIRVAKEDLGIPHIALYGVDDNHGKVGGKMKGATPVTYSWNWLLLKMIEDKLRAHPIDEFAVEPAGALFFYAAGIEFQAIHGHHNIKGWGGIPYYGIQRYDAKSVRLHNRLFRYLLMGHIHQTAEITVGTGAETIVSGDWVGANNLSMDIAAASRPQQKVLYCAHKWGITETARIYLTDTEAAYEPTRIYGQAAA